ncbi:MAG: hypothetical protein WB611_20580 [Stellaceae bacterium]
MRRASQLARREPQLADLALFLSQTYNLKAVADYELGPGAAVPLDRASAAIDRASPRALVAGGAGVHRPAISAVGAAAGHGAKI